MSVECQRKHKRLSIPTYKRACPNCGSFGSLFVEPPSGDLPACDSVHVDDYVLCAVCDALYAVPVLCRLFAKKRGKKDKYTPHQCPQCRGTGVVRAVV